MKNISIILLLCVISVFAEVTVNNNPYTFQHLQNKFGSHHMKRATPEGTESIITFPPQGLFSEQNHLDEFMDSLEFHRLNPEIRKKEKEVALLNCTIDDHPEYLKFFPAFIGSLHAKNKSFSYSAPCFQENTISLEFVDSGTVEVVLKNSKPKNLLCSETYFFSTLINYHLEPVLIRGTHKYKFKVSPQELEQIKTTGIFVFRTCDKLQNLIPDLLKTALLFAGEIKLLTGWDINNHSVPTEMDIKNSIEFVRKATGYEYQKRPKDVLVTLDESLVGSGDFFAVRKFDGTGNLVEYGTGSHVNHCTVALRVNGSLYIAESNSNFTWPVEGLQMTPYKTWIKWAQNQGYMVTWLPLKKEFAQKFDINAALKWFESVKGLPYGIHSYIWGWLDTPDHNYPPILAPEFFASMFGMIEKSKPESIRQMFTLGLNKRLGGTNFSTIAEVAREAYNRNLTLPDLYAIVEQDGWEYPDGLSYVCSAFVAGVLKAGGLFGDLPVNAVEFAPRDVYQLEFYDPNPTVPANCKAVDPTNPFCQIMGGYRMEFQGIGSVKVYAHMNEKCWSEPPLYERYPPGC